MQKNGRRHDSTYHDAKTFGRVARAALLSVLTSLTAVLVAAPTSSAPAAASATSWQPALGTDFPDPDVIHVGTTYYAYSTQEGSDNVPFSTSTDGVHWSNNSGDALPKIGSWADNGFTWGPSVAETASGSFVLFYAAFDNTGKTECIGEATAASPVGPFVDTNAGPIECYPSAGGDIDPAVFTDTATGQSTLLWKQDANAVGRPTSLWSAPLSPSLTVDGAATKILTSDQAWQGGIIEGPAMTEVDGTFYLFYSGNQWATSWYAIGYATCASPAGPCTDNPQNPVLKSAGGMYGPGGPSFFVGPSGLSMGFAAWDGTIGNYSGGKRALYTASVTFEGGVPSFAPVPQNAGNVGYWLFGADGVVNAFNAPSLGTTTLDSLSGIVGAAATPDGGGYWQVSGNGTVYTHGDATFHGDLQGATLNKPIVGMAATPNGGGYWLVASDGGIFAFGNAPYYGSMGGQPLNSAIVGMAADPTTGGYWLVAGDGGIFSFGAPFFGSTGSLHLNRPVVGMTSSPDGGGYWFVASDGGIFSYGDAGFHGSTGSLALNRPVVGMTSSPNGDGYWLVASDGGIFSFGNANYAGSDGGNGSGIQAVALQTAPDHT